MKTIKTVTPDPKTGHVHVEYKWKPETKVGGWILASLVFVLVGTLFVLALPFVLAGLALFGVLYVLVIGFDKFSSAKHRNRFKNR